MSALHDDEDEGAPEDVVLRARGAVVNEREHYWAVEGVRQADGTHQLRLLATCFDGTIWAGACGYEDITARLQEERGLVLSAALLNDALCAALVEPLAPAEAGEPRPHLAVQLPPSSPLQGSGEGAVHFVVMLPARMFGGATVPVRLPPEGGLTCIAGTPAQISYLQLVVTLAAEVRTEQARRQAAEARVAELEAFLASVRDKQAGGGGGGGACLAALLGGGRNGSGAVADAVAGGSQRTVRETYGAVGAPPPRPGDGAKRQRTGSQGLAAAVGREGSVVERLRAGAGGGASAGSNGGGSSGVGDVGRGGSQLTPGNALQSQGGLLLAPPAASRLSQQQQQQQQARGTQGSTQGSAQASGGSGSGALPAASVAAASVAAAVAIDATAALAGLAREASWASSGSGSGGSVALTAAAAASMSAVTAMPAMETAAVTAVATGVGMPAGALPSGFAAAPWSQGTGAGPSGAAVGDVAAGAAAAGPALAGAGAQGSPGPGQAGTQGGGARNPSRLGVRIARGGGGGRGVRGGRGGR